MAKAGTKNKGQHRISKRGVLNEGRPLAIPTPEEFERRARAYFDECETNKKPKCITGLAVACGIWRRKIYEYMKRPAFSDSIKKALAECEQEAEIIALTARNPAGAIFVLKNYGWADKSEVDHRGQQPASTTIIIQGLYGQPGDVPLPKNTVLVQRNAIAKAGGNGDNGGDGNGKH